MTVWFDARKIISFGTTRVNQVHLSAAFVSIDKPDRGKSRARLHRPWAFRGDIEQLVLKSSVRTKFGLHRVNKKCVRPKYNRKCCHWWWYTFIHGSIAFQLPVIQLLFYSRPNWFAKLSNPWQLALNLRVNCVNCPKQMGQKLFHLMMHSWRAFHARRFWTIRTLRKGHRKTYAWL